MIPARSVAASVVALGFAGTLTAPIPAFAAPATCGLPRHYAAQSSAELLRIDRLDLGPRAGVTNRKGSAAGEAASTSRSAPIHKSPSGTSGAGDSSAPGTDGAGPAITGAVPGGSTGALPTTTDDDDAGEGADGSGSGRAADGHGSRGAAGGGGGTGGSGGQVPGMDAEYPAHTLPAWEDSTGGQGGGHGVEPVGDERTGGGQAGGQGADTAIGGVGLGDARTVLIADGPVNSAGAARILNGQVAGSGARNELVVQQAPPINPRGVVRRTGSQRFGPVKVGDGSLTARATWAHGTACGSPGGDTSTAAAEISRVTITGGGSGSLVRVPERISSRSGTALRLRGGSPQSVASATITAGRISLVDNEVRIRVLQAPELRVSMTADGQSRMDYQPAVVEVTGKDGTSKRLATAGDHVDITLSEEVRPLESLPARLGPIGGSPLPKVPGLPHPGEPESTRAPSPAPGSTVRITLGDARQATSGNAIAARATAIRVTVVRGDDSGRSGRAVGPTGLVADLGIGMLEAAAVAPSGTMPGRGSSARGATGSSAHGTTGGGVSGSGAAAGPAAAAGGLPITGPRVEPLFLVGAGLIIVGVCAVILASRRRRNDA